MGKRMSIKSSSLSRWVLWACMFLSLVVFAVYKTDGLLIWLYILLLVTLISVVCFSVVQSLERWKVDKRSMVRPLVGMLSLILLLGVSYGLGSGVPLPISGYDGTENTYCLLKITDMWMYSIYVLLAVCLLSVIVGIVWSYIKKPR